MAFLTLLKKTFFSIFSLFKKLFSFIFLKIALKILLLPFYKFYLHSKKIINENKLFTQNNFLISLVTKRSGIHILLIIISILVVTSNIKAKEQDQSMQIQRNLLSSLLKRDEEVIIEEGAIAPTENPNDNLIFLSEDDIQTLEEEETEQGPILAKEGMVIVKPNMVSTPPIPRIEIEEYTVQEDDTIGGIAEKFNISVATILWENNLTERSLIKPDQKLTILPTSGLSHKVKNGETLDKIAKTYQANVQDILDINDLDDSGKIKIGQKLVIPGGKMPRPTYTRPASAISYIKNIFSKTKTGQGEHIFPWGQCTWYVAQKRFIPWSGHAKNWLSNAPKYGYKIGNSPQVGAIIAIRESWYGHVGYVETVGNNTVTFSESNHAGLGVVTKRTFNINDRRIIGYIY